MADGLEVIDGQHFSPVPVMIIYDSPYLPLVLKTQQSKASAELVMSCKSTSEGNDAFILVFPNVVLVYTHSVGLGCT